MLESRGRIGEHHAVDGECRGGDRAWLVTTCYRTREQFGRDVPLSM
jgi:hypothetical protein